MNIYENFAQLFSDYRNNYVRIFEVLYPAKNGTGFTERNLSVNFAKAYEAKNPAAVTWYEFQFGENNNLHYDAIIIDPPKKEILLIESKRFNNPSKKIREVVADIERINCVVLNYAEFADRLENIAEYTFYGVILSDVWTKGSKRETAKTAILQSFKNHSFLDGFCSELPENDKKQLSDCAYFVGDFPDVSSSETIRNNYHLLSFIWELTAED